VTRDVPCDVELGRNEKKSNLQRRSSVRCSQDPAHQRSSALGSAPASTPPFTTKALPPQSTYNPSVPVTPTLASSCPPPHPSQLPGSSRVLYLDHRPFIQSFSLPAHRIRPAVSAETACPPHELVAERGARCTASREREPVMCAGGKEDAK
jgi:hypothetical protein